MRKSLKVGLALGGGGARGLAHIGVLKALEKCSISIKCLSGISMGAVIGAGYAYDKDLERLEKYALALEYQNLVKAHNQEILINLDKVTKYFNQYLNNAIFSNLKIPLKILTTDLADMKSFVIETGKVSLAIAASCTTPYIHQPLKYEGRLLVDGGLISEVPLELVDSPEIDLIIGVKVASEYQFSEDSLYLSNFQKTIISKFPLLSLLWRKQIDNYQKHSKRIVNNELSELKISMLKKPFIMIEPKLKDINILSFDRAEEAISAGYQATKTALNGIYQNELRVKTIDHRPSGRIFANP